MSPEMAVVELLLYTWYAGLVVAGLVWLIMTAQHKCWFGHKWGKWSESPVTAHDLVQKPVPGVLRRRWCQRCWKAERVFTSDAIERERV